MSNGTFVPRIGDCWNRIGVMGDRSCPELDDVIHCHNCDIYSSAGRALLEQPINLSEMKDTAHNLAQAADEHSSNEVRLLFFRLGNDSFAIPLSALQEVTTNVAIHTVPHLSSHNFLGLASVQGDVLLCLSLHACLDVARPDTDDSTRARILVIREGDELWGAPVDEVYGIEAIESHTIQRAPDTVQHSAAPYTSGMLTWNDSSVAILDGPTLCSQFRVWVRS